MNIENELSFLVSIALGNAKGMFPELMLTENLNTIDNFWRGVKLGLIKAGDGLPLDIIKIDELLEPIYCDYRDEEGRWIRIYPRIMNDEYMNWLRNQLNILHVYLGELGC